MWDQDETVRIEFVVVDGVLFGEIISFYINSFREI